MPKGRSLVPTKIKEDLLGKIKTHLETDEDYKKMTGYWYYIIGYFHVIDIQIVELLAGVVDLGGRPYFSG